MSKQRLALVKNPDPGVLGKYFHGVLEVGRKSRGSPIFVFDFNLGGPLFSSLIAFL